MIATRLRVCAAGLSLLLVACTDSTPTTSGITSLEEGRGNLDVSLHAVSSVQAQRALDVRPLDSADLADLPRVGGLEPSTAALLEESAAIISFAEVKAGFSTEFGKPVAYAQARMHYFGNAARQQVQLLPRRGVTPIPVPLATEEQSHVMPGFYGMTSSTRVPLGESCGHHVWAASQHRAWNASPIPGTPSSSFLPAELARQSPEQHQPTCTPERREESDTVPAGGGATGKGTDDVQWYICTFEVWYDRTTGAELSRTLLSCHPL